VPAVPGQTTTAQCPKALSTPCPFRLGKPAAYAGFVVPSIRLSTIDIRDESQLSGRIDADRCAGNVSLRAAPSIGNRFAMPGAMGGPPCDLCGQTRGWRANSRGHRNRQSPSRDRSAMRSCRGSRDVRWQSVEGEQQAKPGKAPKQPCVDEGLATVGGTAPENPNARMWWFSLTARPASGSGGWIDDLGTGRLFSRSRAALISS